MILGLELMGETFNIGVDVILTFVVFGICLPFAAKGFDLFLMVWMIANGLLSVGFNAWGTNFDWSLPFKLFIICVILLALNLYKRTSTENSII